MMQRMIGSFLILLLFAASTRPPAAHAFSLFRLSRDLAHPSNSLTSLGLSQSTDDWTTLINLSRSGASDSPQMVIDSSGRHHVLWEDSIDGFVYASGGQEGWSEPRVVELPFYTRRDFSDLQPQTPTPRFSPLLVADQNGRIHAFWVDNVSDKAGLLKHSSVSSNSFAQIDSWSVPQVLETGGVGAAVAVNGSRLYLTYVRNLDTADRPAGVYYQSLSIESGTWSGGRPLYISRYLRSATNDTANVTIAVTENNLVLVAWDDLAKEQVFASRSIDGGASWEAPFEIDRRGANDSPGATGPYGVSIAIGSGSPILVWQAAHEAAAICIPYYRTIPVDGTSWSLPQPVPGIDGCPSSLQLINDGGTLYLLGTIEEGAVSVSTSRLRAFLMAWDGSQWSDPRPQDTLAEMLNPDTNQPINLHCLSGVAFDGQISVVGCDRGVGADIWWAIRRIGDTSSWFPPPASWEGPVAVAAAAEPIAGLGMSTDASGRSHVMWFEENGGQLYHAYRDETGWSPVRSVVTVNDGPINTLVTGSNGTRLFATFSANDGLYFIQADAAFPTEWSMPTSLLNEPVDVSSHFFLPSEDGELLVAYTVALNEPRGVYILRSPDSGLTWSGPAQAFNGALEEWPAVGRPYLAETSNGQLHGVWTRRALPPDMTNTGLAYSRSDDKGATWSPPVLIVDTAVLWVSLHGYGDRVVHLVWAEPSGEQMMLWHSLSADSGATWSESVQIGSLDSSDFPVALNDPTGQLHILGFEGGRLVSWTFNGARWESADPLTVNLADGGEAGAVVDSNGLFVATYGLAIPPSGDGQATGGLFAMERPLDLPRAALPTPPPPAATSTPAPTIAPTPAPEATPTIVLPTAPDSNPLSVVPGAGSRTGQLILAVIPAALVVLVAVLVGVRAMRKGGR